MDTMTKEFVVNRDGEKFYVGDIVCFRGLEASRCKKTITKITDRGSWQDERMGSPWIPDNLVLIERPNQVTEGWTL